MTLEQDSSLARALDDVTTGVMVLTRDWRVEFVNRAVEGFFGVRREDLLGRVVQDVFPLLRGTEAERKLFEGAHTPGPSEVELLAPGRSGRLITRIYPSHGGVVLTFRAAAERRTHLGEARLTPDQQDLARHARDQVLGIVSHDLRGPLNSIALNAAVLVRRPGDTRALDAITSGVMHAHRLLQDLVLATRVESGTLTLRRQAESMREVVEEVATQHAALARARDVRLDVVVRDEAATAMIDRARVMQVLGTLLARALAATPKGGSVTLEASAQGGGLEVAIQDSGPGMPVEEARRLFDGSWERARSEKNGTSLALCIAKGLAEAHGGSLSVDSGVGLGTRITLRIPPEDGAGLPFAQASAP
jgi:signal transduction histidine kinase